MLTRNKSQLQDLMLFLKLLPDWIALGGELVGFIVVLRFRAATSSVCEASSVTSDFTGELTSYVFTTLRRLSPIL